MANAYIHIVRETSGHNAVSYGSTIGEHLDHVKMAQELGYKKLGSYTIPQESFALAADACHEFERRHLHFERLEAILNGLAQLTPANASSLYTPGRRDQTRRAV